MIMTTVPNNRVIARSVSKDSKKALNRYKTRVFSMKVEVVVCFTSSMNRGVHCEVELAARG
jgi:sulfur relay (sulfurtransferase) complex TusBCD TusD component (DsrE family)